MPKFSKELKIAIEAAKVGAKTALRYFDNNTDLKTTSKEDNSALTIADPLTEKTIKEFIYSKFPDTNIVGEETGGSTKHNSFWIIDPIDGTRVYARGINSWAVLIAYYSENEFKIGVCYFPMFNELYYAEKGKGTYLNGKRVNVSQINLLKSALVNSGNPRNFKSKTIVPELIENCRVLRGYESTYADCLVSAGKMDASIDPYAKLWDYAPFVTLINESGGKITNLKGEPIGLTDQGCIISNRKIHDEIVEIVNS